MTPHTMSRNLFRRAPRWLLLYIPILLIFIAVSLFLALRLPRISGGLTIDNPRFEQEPPGNDKRLLPSIVRYVSSLKDEPSAGRIAVRFKTCCGFPACAARTRPKQIFPSWPFREET